jgi:hypothetical protein
MIRTMEDLRGAPPDAGVVREFQEPYARVLAACKDAIVQTGLTIKETSASGQSRTVILSERGFTAMSWGELVRVVVQESGGRLTSVRVLTLRRLAVNLTAKGDYSKTIFANILAALEKS